MKLLDAGKWIYRGQEDASWSLESGLDRYLKKFGKAGLRKNPGVYDEYGERLDEAVEVIMPALFDLWK